jgi:hypothetical protein
MFPLCAPFLPSAKSEALLRRMSGGSSDNLYALGRGLRNLPECKFLRYCPQCVENDILAYGDTFWRTLHQVPGVCTCPIHREVLMNSEISRHEACTKLVAADCNMAGSQCAQLKGKDLDDMVSISADCLWLLQNGFKCGSLEITKARYKKLFRNFPIGADKASCLKAFVDNRFSCKLLALENAEETAWIKRMLKFQNSLLHPILHVIMIKALNEDVENFFLENPDIERLL